MKIMEFFAGVGGWSLGMSRAGFKTVGLVEFDPYCQQVLESHHPGVKIFGDITNEETRKQIVEFATENDVSGFVGSPPCQPFSIAGAKKSTKDDRDLWPQFFDCIKQARPTFILFENSPEFINLAFTRTKLNLENEGYAVRPFIIPACAVGALHRRDRAWIYAKLVTDLDGGRIR